MNGGSAGVVGVAGGGVSVGVVGIGVVIGVVGDDCFKKLFQ